MLETDRLIIRRFSENDLEPWLAHLNTPEVRAHLGGVVPEDEMTAKFARQKVAWDDGKGGWLAIERKADGEFLGYCGFGPITAEAAPADLQGTTEIGLAEAAQDQTFGLQHCISHRAAGPSAGHGRSARPSSRPA